MSAISDLYRQTSMAEAAYANFWDQVTGLIPVSRMSGALITEGMTATQAQALLDTWDVIDHVPNLDSGFSATIFRSRADPGHYTLAIRGSLLDDLAIDFRADGALIVNDGVAVVQLVDLYNFWQRALTPKGQSYTAARLAANEGSAPPITVFGVSAALKIEFVNSSQLADPEMRAGSGAIGSLLTDLDVTGHSLGGHLAMAFTRLYPNFGAQALAVNGLGFKLDNANVNNLFTALGGANGFNAAQIQNIYGIAGSEFAAMNNFLLQQPGFYDGIFIESGGLVTVGGHSGIQMTDSMAIYSAFAAIAPNLTVRECK